MNFDKATLVQFALFTLDDELQAEQLFQQAFGQAPVETQVNRTPTPQKNFLSVASAVASDNVQAVRVSPGRIDFQITALESLEKAAIATTGAADAVEKLLTSINQVDFEDRNFLRLAVNATLMLPQKSFNDAREAFFELTCLPKLAHDVQELVLQVNSRRKIDQNLEINRLVQYMTALFQIGQFQFQSSGVSPTAILELPATGVQLDFNTVPGNVLITPEGVMTIFQEICDDVQHAIACPSLREIFRG